jgi:hypothetical protein
MAVAGGPNIVEDGLVLALDAANVKSYESGSTVWSDLVSSPQFTLTNGPTFSSDALGTLVYDGSNDTSIYSSGPPSSWNIAVDGGFSMGGWINLAAKAGFSQWLRFSDFFFYFQTDSGFVRLYYPSAIDITLDLGVGSWVYWMAVADRPNDKVYLYKNGTLMHTQSAATSTGTPGTGQSSIGDESPGGENLGGSMGTVQLYNRALTASEVLQNYNATKGRFGL